MKKPIAQTPETAQNGPAELARITSEAEEFRLMSGPQRDEETRRRKSEAMKEFIRKTGKGTAVADMMLRRPRKPK